MSYTRKLNSLQNQILRIEETLSRLKKDVKKLRDLKTKRLRAIEDILNKYDLDEVSIPGCKIIIKERDVRKRKTQKEKRQACEKVLAELGIDDPEISEYLLEELKGDKVPKKSLVMKKGN